MNNYLQRQAAEVRKVRKAHPNMKYMDAVKKAARNLKAGKVAAPKKKVGSVTKHMPKKKASHNRAKTGATAPLLKGEMNALALIKDALSVIRTCEFSISVQQNRIASKMDNKSTVAKLKRSIEQSRKMVSNQKKYITSLKRFI